VTRLTVIHTSGGSRGGELGDTKRVGSGEGSVSPPQKIFEF